MRSSSFWQELGRRHACRAAAACAIAGGLLIQATTQVVPVVHLPESIDQAVVLVIPSGFPIALVPAWAFDATPDGIVRMGAAPVGAPLRRRSCRTTADGAPMAELLDRLKQRKLVQWALAYLAGAWAARGGAVDAPLQSVGNHGWAMLP